MTIVLVSDSETGGVAYHILALGRAFTDLGFKVLVIYPSGTSMMILRDNFSEIIEVQYPSVDMQNLPFKMNTFDFVIIDQVIEHLENPQQAVNESYHVLKTVISQYIPHGL